MSGTLNSTRTRILEWLKDGGLVAVTIAGVLLYVLLSFPVTVFNSRLGTSPGEVGITYVSLLSGSAVGISAILILLTTAVFIVAFVVAYLVFARLYVLHLPNTIRLLQTNIWEVPDTEFEHQLRVHRQFQEAFPDIMELARQRNPKWPRTVADYETLMRRGRELRKLRAPTAADSDELYRIRDVFSRPLYNVRTLPWDRTKLWIRRRGVLLAATSFVLTMIVVLPALAFAQAGQVLDGKAYYGQNTGAFGYGAEPVKVQPASQQPAPGIQALTTKTLFLLGQNAQYVILYSPSDHSTVRVPITAVIISSV